LLSTTDLVDLEAMFGSAPLEPLKAEPPSDWRSPAHKPPDWIAIS
jgi:hypothetical protein